MLIIIYNIYIIYYYNIIYIIICNLFSSKRRSKTTLLLFVICYLLFSEHRNVFSWFRLTVFCLFPDVVDSRFPERVDSLPDIVDTVPGFVDISWKCWHLLRRSPKPLKHCVLCPPKNNFVTHNIVTLSTFQLWKYT